MGVAASTLVPPLAARREPDARSSYVGAHPRCSSRVSEHSTPTQPPSARSKALTRVSAPEAVLADAIPGTSRLARTQKSMRIGPRLRMHPVSLIAAPAPSSWLPGGWPAVSVLALRPPSTSTSGPELIPEVVGFLSCRVTRPKYSTSSPETRRPKQPTPLRNCSRIPCGLHPYAYARNNPLDWSDPTGEFAVAIAPLLGPLLADPAVLAAGAVLGGAVPKHPQLDQHDFAEWIRLQKT